MKRHESQPMSSTTVTVPAASSGGSNTAPIEQAPPVPRHSYTRSDMNQDLGFFRNPPTSHQPSNQSNVASKSSDTGNKTSYLQSAKSSNSSNSSSESDQQTRYRSSYYSRMPSIMESRLSSSCQSSGMMSLMQQSSNDSWSGNRYGLIRPTSRRDYRQETIACEPERQVKKRGFRSEEEPFLVQLARDMAYRHRHHKEKEKTVQRVDYSLRCKPRPRTPPPDPLEAVFEPASSNPCSTRSMNRHVIKDNLKKYCCHLFRGNIL